MRRVFLLLFLLSGLAAGLFYILTMPSLLTAADLPNHEPDLKNGGYIFHAGGCASCHAAPASGKCNTLKIQDELKLVGGRCLKTDFGTFYVPNISPDKENGIGGWSALDFINAMARGVSPSGSHYYPAFPFTSYQRMKLEDLIDLKAYLDTLPPVKSDVPDHDLVLLFRMRRGLGLWKLLYLDGELFVPNPSKSAEINRGAYLVRGPGHCGECHTPRNLIGGFLADKAYSGAAAAEGEGFVPNITPHKDGLGSWSKADIVELLETGFLPDFDVIGGAMTEVQENMAKLTAEDREAIAGYLKSLKPIASKKREKAPDS